MCRAPVLQFRELADAGVEGVGWVQRHPFGPGAGQDGGTVSISITPVNDPPQAVDDFAEVAEDGFVLIQVRSNDDDPDGDTLDLTAVSTSAHGSAVIEGRLVHHSAEVKAVELKVAK